MKKAVVVMMAVLCVSAAAFAQDGGKPKIAVYVSGGEDTPKNKQISTMVQSALGERGWFSNYERGPAFQDVVDKELEKQKDGSVDQTDSLVCEAGRQKAVQYVCVADVTSSDIGTMLSIRILDVNTFEVIGVGDIHFNWMWWSNIPEFKKKIEEVMKQKSFQKSVITALQRKKGK